MRVLVLGADGFVGRRLLGALAAADWAIPVAGARRPAPPNGSGRIVLDAADRAAVAAAVAGVDAVVNCVAGDPATIARGAQALFAAARGRRVVHLSSMAVYGAAEGRIAEDAPLVGDAGGYAGAKVAAERAAAGAPNTVLLRPGCIYGPGGTQWSWRIARLLAARRIGDLGAAGDGCSNLVHVDDVVAAALGALRSDVGGAFNLAMADAPDWNDYFLHFARALGETPIRRVPAWQMRLETLAAVPLKLAERAGVPAPPPIPPSLLALWRRDVKLDARRAATAFGLDWTPLDRGVAGAAQWCRARLRPTSSS